MHSIKMNQYKKFKITMAMEALIAPWQRNETGSVSSSKEKKKISLQLALEMLFMPWKSNENNLAQMKAIRSNNCG